MSPKSERDLQEITLPADVPVVPVERGARLPRFVGLACDAGEVLAALRVAVIGAGSVGRAAALHLARLMIGTLVIIDRGRFKSESLLTQPIDPSDIGDAKASNAGLLCKRISPRTRVFTYDGPVEQLPRSALADVDVVVMATDNLAAEIEVGKRCQRLGKPLLHASVHGETLVAQVRFFRNADGAGPCPACLFGSSEWNHLNRETTFSCEGLATGEVVAQVETMPTMSVSFLCSLAAELALMQLLRHVLGLGERLQDCLVQYCGYTHQVLVAPLRRNPECPGEHTSWKIAVPPRRLVECTLAELARLTGLDCEHGDGLGFTVDDLKFVEFAACRRCGQPRPIQRFLAPGPEAGSCDCGGTLVVQEFYAHRPVPAAMLGSLLEQPLAALGVEAPREVLVRGLDRAVLFIEK